jgi:hypothetical protein
MDIKQEDKPIHLKLINNYLRVILFDYAKLKDVPDRYVIKEGTKNIFQSTKFIVNVLPIGYQSSDVDIVSQQYTINLDRPIHIITIDTKNYIDVANFHKSPIFNKAELREYLNDSLNSAIFERITDKLSITFKAEILILNIVYTTIYIKFNISIITNYLSYFDIIPLELSKIISTKLYKIDLSNFKKFYPNVNNNL